MFSGLHFGVGQCRALIDGYVGSVCVRSVFVLMWYPDKTVIVSFTALIGSFDFLLIISTAVLL